MPADQQPNIELQLSTLPWDQVEVDGFVVPTNSACEMSAFPASEIRELTGSAVERELAGHTPLAIGAALVTSATNMRARHLIHVANTEKPGHPVEVEGVRRAIAAALLACVVRDFSTIAVPLMGAFEHGFPPREAARAICSELATYRHARRLTALLMARGAEDVAIFQSALERNPDG